MRHGCRRLHQLRCKSTKPPWVCLISPFLFNLAARGLQYPGTADCRYSMMTAAHGAPCRSITAVIDASRTCQGPQPCLCSDGDQQALLQAQLLPRENAAQHLQRSAIITKPSHCHRRCYMGRPKAGGSSRSSSTISRDCSRHPTDSCKAV